MLRIIETFEFEGTPKGHLVQLLCDEQGHPHLHQVAQSPTLPDLECLQGQGIHHLSGQSVPVPLLQAEQPQLPQPVLTGKVCHPSDHFCGPPLVVFQQVHISPVLRTPHLDAVLVVLRLL